MSKLNWKNLTKEEGARYMDLQTAPWHSKLISITTVICAVCGKLNHNRGLCDACYQEWRALRDRLEA